MRHIDKSIVAQFAKDIGWEEKEKAHLAELETRSPKERSEYFNTHRDWNEFQPIMIKEFGYKCWYSEARIGAGEFEIDHFRPKNRSRQYDGEILKENGYWWLAYNWENYRLSGSLINKRRRDRLKDSSCVEGKGDYFPLYLNTEERGKIAGDCCSVACELPILLDPFCSYDVDLISFDENGEVITNTIGPQEEFRVLQSIEFYHLDHEQLNYQRSLIWNSCVEEIEDARKGFYESQFEHQKRDCLDKCFRNLKRMCDKKSEFSSVAVTCVKLYSRLDDYKKFLGRFRY